MVASAAAIASPTACSGRLSASALRVTNDIWTAGGAYNQRTVLEFDLSGYGEFVADPAALGKVELSLDLQRTSLASTNPTQLTAAGTRAFFTVGTNQQIAVVFCSIGKAHTHAVAHLLDLPGTLAELCDACGQLAGQCIEEVGPMHR